MSVSIPLIFIVDDDPVFSNILGMMLNQNGYEKLVFFTSAEKCLESLSDNPSFLFLDYHMEGMDGLAALKQIRKQTPDCKIFLITSLEDDRIKQLCLEAGASLFLKKTEVLNGLPKEVSNSLEQLTG